MSSNGDRSVSYRLCLNNRSVNLEGSLNLQGSMGYFKGSMGNLKGSMGDLEGSMGDLERSLNLQGSMGGLKGSLVECQGYMRSGDWQGSRWKIELSVGRWKRLMDDTRSSTGGYSQTDDHGTDLK